MQENLIDRINTLARKAKSTGLTPEEKEEQKRLRQEYLKSFRQQMAGQIESIRLFDAEGNELTPEKVQKIQIAKGIRKDSDQ